MCTCVKQTNVYIMGKWACKQGSELFTFEMMEFGVGPQNKQL